MSGSRSLKFVNNGENRENKRTLLMVFLKGARRGSWIRLYSRAINLLGAVDEFASRELESFKKSIGEKKKKKSQSVSKLTTVSWLSGIPPFCCLFFKYHDPKQGAVSMCCAERVKAATVCSVGDDPGCAAGVRGGLRRPTTRLPFFIS